MTTSVETNPNGRVRKTLASQLDRLDTILDGLSDALNESVSAAVQTAVSDVLTQILTNPTFADRLRSSVPTLAATNASTESTAPPERPPSPPRPGPVGKLTGAARAGCGHVRRACGAVLRRAVALAGSGRSYVWDTLFRGRLVPLVAVIATLGLVVFLSGPHLPWLISGAAGLLGALVARARSALRRSPSPCISGFE